MHICSSTQSGQQMLLQCMSLSGIVGSINCSCIVCEPVCRCQRECTVRCSVSLAGPAVPGVIPVASAQCYLRGALCPTPYSLSSSGLSPQPRTRPHSSSTLCFTSSCTSSCTCGFTGHAHAHTYTHTYTHYTHTHTPTTSHMHHYTCASPTPSHDLQGPNEGQCPICHLNFPYSKLEQHVNGHFEN